MDTAVSLKRTALYDAHVEMGARLVPFAGWSMPVQYKGVLDESMAVRTKAGMFDISHMGRFAVTGGASADLLQRVTTNDVSALADGRAQYSLLTRPDGGILDDIIVYRWKSDRYMLVVNASNAEKDMAWLTAHAEGEVVITDESDQTAMIAVQGPRAVELLSSLMSADMDEVPRFGMAAIRWGGGPLTACRTGYTGEDGFELICPVDQAADLWVALSRADCCACGLGARDALRVEAGYPLYGHEINETTTPVEAGLMWAVKLDKGAFVGSDAIAEAKRAGRPTRLMGLRMDGRSLPRQGYEVRASGTHAGAVTSGAFSAAQGVALGMAYLRPDLRAGARVEVLVRDSEHPATVVLKKDLLRRPNGGGQ